MSNSEQKAFELNEEDIRVNNNYEFRKSVIKLNDLKPGMEFVGQVTTITSFGAFVNIGTVSKCAVQSPI